MPSWTRPELNTFKGNYKRATTIKTFLTREYRSRLPAVESNVDSQPEAHRGEKIRPIGLKDENRSLAQFA